MKKILMLLAVAAVLTGCHDHYTRGPVKGEDGALGILHCYGTANSIIAYDSTEVHFDVKAYSVNELNHTIFSTTEVDTLDKAAEAKVIWIEKGMTIGSVTLNADRTVTVSGIAGSGNALVGIWNNKGTLLWSYHIWKPREDPNKVLEYAALGGCEVMPFALGAMEAGRMKANGSLENIDATAGLYYMHGRKDPLGRADFSKVSGDAGACGFIECTMPEEGNAPVEWDTKGADAILTSVKSEYINNYSGDKSYKELVDEIISMVDANSKEFLIEYATQHPMTTITPAIGSSYWYAADSIYRDRTLWYQTKSCYDPCPAGYMTAPNKLYRGFLSTATTVIGSDNDGTETSENVYAGDNSAINATNAYTMPKAGGYNFRYYGTLDTNKTDFYPAAGYRQSKDGQLLGVTKSGYYTSYTVSFGASTGYQRILYFDKDTIRAYRGIDQNACCTNVRCMKIKVFDDLDNGGGTD